jgi:hypothetical protein
MTDEDLRQRYVSQIDRLYSMPTFVRSFAYFTFPVYGYFIRQMDPDWNIGITNKTNLSALISDYFNISNQKLEPDEITIIGKSYNIDSISRFEEERELTQLVQIKKYKAQFLGDSVLSIMLVNIDIAFNAKAAMPLDTHGIVYPNLRITDNWGILEVDSCGALVSADWKFVTISYPEKITDTLITGKGWKLKLYEGWRLKKEDKKYVIKSK